MGNRGTGWRKAYRCIAAVLIIVPLAALPFWSITGRWPWPELFPHAVSLRGVLEVLGGSGAIVSLVASSIMLSLVVALLAAIIGTMAARALVFYNFPGKSLVAFGSMLPLLVPATAFAMGVHVVFIDLGLADTFFGVVLVHVIYSVPYTINIMLDLTALTGDHLEQQSMVLGGTPSQSFYHISLPLLMPGIISSMSIAFIISFSQYFLTLIIGGGSVQTLSVVMVPFIQSGDRTIAASYALLFVVSTFAVFIALEVMLKRYSLRISKLHQE